MTSKKKIETNPDEAPETTATPEQAAKALKNSKRAARAKSTATKSRVIEVSTLQSRVKRISELVGRTQASAAQVQKAATDLLASQKALDAEVAGLLRLLNMSIHPDDREAAQGISRMRMSGTANLRTISGILGGVRQLHNLSKYKLSIDA